MQGFERRIYQWRSSGESDARPCENEDSLQEDIQASRLNILDEMSLNHNQSNEQIASDTNKPTLMLIIQVSLSAVLCFPGKPLALAIIRRKY